MPNNVVTKQPDSIPLHSVTANSIEHSGLNSGMPKFHQNAKNSRPSCQISFHWIPLDSNRMTGFRRNDWIPAGIRGALIRPPLLGNLCTQWSQHLESFAKVACLTVGRMPKRPYMLVKHVLGTVGASVRGRLTSMEIGRRLLFAAIIIIMPFQFIQQGLTPLIIDVERQSRLSALLT